MAKRGKRYNKTLELIEANTEPLVLSNAFQFIKQGAKTKFDESVDIDMRLGVDPRHADQMVRGSVALPHGTGKTVRVLVMASESFQQAAKDAGADHVGLQDYVEKINGGWTDIDVIIATPDVMGEVGKLGRVLGPRGLMPNPKSGTVTKDVAAAIAAVKAGKIDFRVDKAGNLHASVGKASFEAAQLAENAETFVREVLRLRPSSAKGTYVKSITVSTTMGPALRLDHLEVVGDLR